MAHPYPEVHWDDAHDPTSEQYAKLSIPILTITGSHDDDQPGAWRGSLDHGASSGALPENGIGFAPVTGPICARVLT